MTRLGAVPGGALQPGAKQHYVLYGRTVGLAGPRPERRDADLAYDYSVDGQLAGIRDLLDPVESIEIDYDNLNRLIMVSEVIPVIPAQINSTFEVGFFSQFHARKRKGSPAGLGGRAFKI